MTTPPPLGSRRLWVEPARPRWLRHRPTAHYYALAAVCVGAFMGQLDASIVTVAFPTLQHVFHASVAAVTWVGLSYLIVLVAGVTAVGRLADMVGRKLLYTYGFLVFVVGSGLCAVAPDLAGLDAFRVVQAVGAAMLQANSVAIIYLAMPRHRLARGLGIQGAAQALGLALGPSVGGLLLAAGGWRLIFLVNVPAGLIGTVAAWILIPRSRDLPPRSPYDWPGLALFLPAVVALLVAVSFSTRWGWTSPPTAALAAVAVMGGALFLRRERQTPEPMLDLSLFRQPRFSAAVASGLCANLTLFGTMVAVPFFLERSAHENPGRAGLVLTALPLALGCVAPFSGRMAEHLGTRRLTAGAMALCAGALAGIGLLAPTGWGLAAGLAVVGLGLGLFVAPNNTTIMSAAPPSRAGTASGVLNMTRGLGTALGLSVIGAVVGTGLRATPASAGGGFGTACLVLAAVAAGGGVIAALSRPDPSGRHQGRP
ncbi:MAG: DHA2 family efflux MFS transporter permease subunit [Acidimicrobiales bacterium]